MSMVDDTIQVRETNTPEEIERIKSIAIEYGIQRLGYSERLAREVGNRVEQVLRTGESTEW
jgi:hypothetical protein